jgi:acyl-CoA synthetase (NDP forming)
LPKSPFSDYHNPHSKGKRDLGNSLYRPDLVVLSGMPIGRGGPMIQVHDNTNTEYDRRFGAGFPPESIAIVGISRKGGSLIPGYTGLQLFKGLKEYGYKGRLYPVNPKATEILGEKAYASVVDIPERLDLVIVAVQAPVVPQVIDDCVAAKARYVHICSSGFGETGLAEGERLEREVLEKAVNGGVKIIGPNCMGFNVPSAQITTFPDIGVLPRGTVGFITQSGGHARSFLMNAQTMGLGFSSVISYGNGLMLDAVDFTEYLAEDLETEIICIYLEGIRRGRRLAEVVKRTTPRKPVILWKGGLTTPGSRAASSHTGSMAGSESIWNGFYRQTGSIRADTLEELVETAMALHMFRPFSSARTAVMTMGGGSTVQSGDICGREGLVVPRFSPDTIRELFEFVSTVNQGLSNPMDVPGMLLDPIGFPRALRLIAADKNIDLILIGLPSQLIAGEHGVLIQHIKEFNRECPQGKQIAVAVTDNWDQYETGSPCRSLRQKGIPVFRSFSGACRAINRIAKYYHHIDRYSRV